MATVGTARPGDDRVLVLRGEADLFARAGHLFQAREEFVCAAENLGTWKATQPYADVAEQVAERIAAGLRMRKLYNAAALADPRDREHLLRITEAGAEVRICAQPLAQEMIIIDRRVAIVAGRYRGGRRDYHVLRAPEVVAGMCSLYQASWAGAVPLADHLAGPPPQLDETALAVLRLAAAGQKDDTAARTLGISVRTYRRRIAELMSVLGAESRFQAGERARALGLIR